ncbi:dihydroneopterin aldolase [hydrocarbon metagenome]|uniref:dihydroneopterin aldolase n=1 Tax=hydrocarbon metagenome TaxID=938273 RepID=A0A0W8E8N9_9ZZZZ
MDKIIARGLVFYGKHGVLETEKNIPQRFEVDIILHKDLKDAAAQDDLDHTVNYADIFYNVRKIVETESYNLIETLAENIANMILAEYAVENVEVTVYKPCAPVDGEFKYFAVKIERGRK